MTHGLGAVYMMGQAMRDPTDLAKVVGWNFPYKRNDPGSLADYTTGTGKYNGVNDISPTDNDLV
jgi:hypothetical protein